MALPQELQDALRHQARLCRAEILQRVNGVTDQDAIIREVLDKHTALLPGIPSGTITPKTWLVYYVRQLRKE